VIYSDALGAVDGCKDLNVEGFDFNLDPQSHEMNLNYPDEEDQITRGMGGGYGRTCILCVSLCFVFIAVPDTDWIFLATFRIGGPKSQRTVFSDFFAPGKFFSKSVSPK
jgi:hypothetical protein